MLFWDVHNGMVRRNWVKNTEAIFTKKRVMKTKRNLKVKLPNFVDDAIIDSVT